MGSTGSMGSIENVVVSLDGWRPFGRSGTRAKPSPEEGDGAWRLGAGEDLTSWLAGMGDVDHVVVHEPLAWDATGARRVARSRRGQQLLRARRSPPPTRATWLGRTEPQRARRGARASRSRRGAGPERGARLAGPRAGSAHPRGGSALRHRRAAGNAPSPTLRGREGGRTRPGRALRGAFLGRQRDRRARRGDPPRQRAGTPRTLRRRRWPSGEPQGRGALAPALRCAR
jgi:hypothetical protein